jgi:predicted nucleic acid-binding protein
VTGVLVDSNVLLDVLTEDPRWFGWSSESLASAATSDTLAINPLVFAEVSAGFERFDEIDQALSAETFRRLPLPWEAAFEAGRRFVEYRRRGGARRSPLPDFYIGAHAKVAGLRLLTRDAGRYRTYFPEVELIAPALPAG